MVSIKVEKFKIVQKEICRWWPVVDGFLQQFDDHDVWIPKILFQLVFCIFVQAAGKSFNCCFGFSNHKSLQIGNFLSITEMSVSNHEAEASEPNSPFAWLTVEVLKIRL